MEPEQTIKVAIHYISQIPGTVTNVDAKGKIRSTMRVLANGLLAFTTLCGIPSLSKEERNALPKYTDRDADYQTLVAINTINSIIVPYSVQMKQTYGAGTIEIIEALRKLSTEYLRAVGYNGIEPPELEYQVGPPNGGKRRRTRRHRARKARTVRRRAVHRR